MTEAGEKPQVTGAEEQVLAEHRRIRELSEQIERTSTLPELLSRLHELRSVLVAHFLNEEATDGLYDTIRAMAPRQLERLHQLEKEHATLLADLDRVAADARACLAGPVAQVLADAGAMVRKVGRHETAEDNILLDTLYTDLGLGD